MTPEELVGLLAEPARLRLLAAVALGARTDDEIAAVSGVTGRDAAAGRRRLAEAASSSPAPAAGRVDHAALRPGRARQPPPRAGRGQPAAALRRGAASCGAARAGRATASGARPRRDGRRFAPGEQVDESVVDDRLSGVVRLGDRRPRRTAPSLVEGGHLVRGSGIYALPSQDPPPAEPRRADGVRARAHLTTPVHGAVDVRGRLWTSGATVGGRP
jgi:hypothetical protein